MLQKPGTIGAFIAAALALTGLGVASLVRTDVLLFNHSPSIPTGFYIASSEQIIRRGAIVTVRARDVAPEEARRRNFAGDHDRFIKRVAAVPGERVCSDGRTLQIDGVNSAQVFVSLGRPAPHGWIGCRRMATDEFLLLGDSADSFDGRYWGPINRRFVTGVWTPL